MPFPTITDTTLAHPVLAEFENHTAQLEGYLRSEHTDGGGHGDVTATSVTVACSTSSRSSEALSRVETRLRVASSRLRRFAS